MDHDPATPVTRTIDARGLPCPHPVLRAREALRALESGARVLVLATDPLASLDLRAFCLRAGHRVVHQDEVGDELRFLIERA